MIRFFNNLIKTKNTTTINDVAKTDTIPITNIAIDPCICIEDTFDGSIIKMIKWNFDGIFENVNRLEEYSKKIYFSLYWNGRLRNIDVNSIVRCVMSELDIILYLHFLLCSYNEQIYNISDDVFDYLTKIELFIKSLPDVVEKIPNEKEYDYYDTQDQYTNNEKKIKETYSSLSLYLNELYQTKTIKRDFTKETMARIIRMYDYLHYNIVDNVADNFIKLQLQTMLNAKIIVGLKDANFDEISINEKYGGNYILSLVCGTLNVPMEVLDVILDIGADARKYTFMSNTILTDACRELKFDVAKKIFTKNPEKFIIKNKNNNKEMSEINHACYVYDVMTHVYDPANKRIEREKYYGNPHDNLIHIVLGSYIERFSNSYTEEDIISFISFLINDMKINVDNFEDMSHDKYDPKYLTPFQYCAINGQFKIADFLIKMGANINITHRKKNIMWIVFICEHSYMAFKYTSAAQYLLKKNVNIITPTDKRRHSPYSYYKKNKPSHLIILDELIEQTYSKQTAEIDIQQNVQN